MSCLSVLTLSVALSRLVMVTSEFKKMDVSAENQEVTQSVRNYPTEKRRFNSYDNINLCRIIK